MGEKGINYFKLRTGDNNEWFKFFNIFKLRIWKAIGRRIIEQERLLLDDISQEVMMQIFRQISDFDEKKGGAFPFSCGLRCCLKSTISSAFQKACAACLTVVSRPNACISMGLFAAISCIHADPSISFCIFLGMRPKKGLCFEHWINMLIPRIVRSKIPIVRKKYKGGGYEDLYGDDSEIEEGVKSGREEPEEMLLKKELDELLNNELKLLPPNQEKVWRLQLEGFTYDEISGKLGASEDDIRRWRHRGKVKLLKRIKKSKIWRNILGYERGKGNE